MNERKPGFRRPLKLKISNRDILPYLFISGALAPFILLILDSKGFIHLESPPILAGISFLSFLLGSLNYYKSMHPPKGIDLNELPSTADIRVSNFTYRISMNTGIEISFIKFYFAEDAVYMYIRNFSKNYQGPYKLSNINHDSDALQVQNFIKRNTNEAELGVESATGNTKYNFVLRGFSEKDFGLMKDGFSKIGFQS